MDPVSMTFIALLGVVMVGAWLSFVPPTSPKAVRPSRPQINGWTGKPMAPRPPASAPRISRRGFGAHLAATPVRSRTWSPFAYSGMWAQWARR